MPDKIIYLDHAASTPVFPGVTEAMLPFFSEQFGNPSSSTHPFGWLAKEAIETTRKKVAALMGASENEIFFTSGATESINWAHTAWLRLKGTASHFITQPTEHKAVLETCRFMADSGASIDLIPVDSNGIIHLAELDVQLKKKPGAFISIMAVNNETGVKQPLEKICKLKEKVDFVFFCDATQAVGKQEINVAEMCCDLLAFSAHKLGGPKGCGVLYISEDLQQKGFKSFIHGGSQEFGLRAGTQNVPAIAGLGKAIDCSDYFSDAPVSILRDKLERMLQQEFQATIHGSTVERAPHISSVSIPGLKSEKLIMKINHQLAISSGSACSSANVSPSHVLSAMGLSEEVIFSTLRFSLGFNTTETEITNAVEILKKAINC